VEGPAVSLPVLTQTLPNNNFYRSHQSLRLTFNNPRIVSRLVYRRADAQAKGSRGYPWCDLLHIHAAHGYDDGRFRKHRTQRPKHGRTQNLSGKKLDGVGAGLQQSEGLGRIEKARDSK
jgi:hypothetical protein